jgi:hypothetical protein
MIDMREPRAPFWPVLLWRVLNLSKPKTPAQWMVHIVAALIALFLIAWLLRLYIV